MGKLSLPFIEEVSSILSWASCYVSYVAVLAKAHPERVLFCLTFLVRNIAEARRNKGDRWLTLYGVGDSNSVRQQCGFGQSLESDTSLRQKKDPAT